MVTLKLPLALLPCGSVAVQLTVVVPTAKPAPEAGVHTGSIGPSIGSSALAE